MFTLCLFSHIFLPKKKIFSASLQFFVISLNSFGWVNIWVKVAISGDLNPNNMLFRDFKVSVDVRYFDDELQVREVRFQGILECN